MAPRTPDRRGRIGGGSLERLFKYLGSLTVTQGAGAGGPLTLLRWQRRFLRGFRGADGDVALTIARGAGKTTLLAAVSCAYLAGPLRQPRGEVVLVASSSLNQARIAGEHARAFLEHRAQVAEWRVLDTQQFFAITAPRHGRSAALHRQRPQARAWAGAGAGARRRTGPVAAHHLGGDAGCAHDIDGEDSRLAAGGDRDPAGRDRSLVRPDARRRRGLRSGARGPTDRSAVPGDDVAPGESIPADHAGPVRDASAPKPPRRSATRTSSRRSGRCG